MLTRSISVQGFSQYGISTSSVEMKTEIKAVRTFECLLLQGLLSVMVRVNKYRVKWILFIRFRGERVIY